MMIHLFWLKTAAKYLVRSWRSTSVMTFMVIIAVATLIFLSSLATGINDAMIENSVTLYSGHISLYGLSEDIELGDLMVNDVSDVLKRTFHPGILKNNDTSEKIILVGVNPESEIKITAIKRQIINGTYPSHGKLEILISAFISERLRADIGHTLIFNDQKKTTIFRVTGIYQTGIGRLGKEFCFFPEGTGVLKEDIWSASVFIRKGVDPNTVVNDIEKMLGSDPDVKTISWQDAMPDLKQLIDLNGISMLLVTIIVFVLISIGISCAFTIFILNNLKEYGMMKAMGMTPLETCELFLYKVFLLNLVSICIGILAGVLVTSLISKLGIDFSEYTSHNKYFAISGMVYPRLTIDSILYPPFLSMTFSIFAFIWPALIVIRKNTIDILRSL